MTALFIGLTTTILLQNLYSVRYKSVETHPNRQLTTVALNSQF